MSGSKVQIGRNNANGQFERSREQKGLLQQMFV